MQTFIEISVIVLVALSFILIVSLISCFKDLKGLVNDIGELKKTNEEISGLKRQMKENEKEISRIRSIANRYDMHNRKVK